MESNTNIKQNQKNIKTNKNELYQIIGERLEKLDQLSEDIYFGRHCLLECAEKYEMSDLNEDLKNKIKAQIALNYPIFANQIQSYIDEYFLLRANLCDFTALDFTNESKVKCKAIARNANREKCKLSLIKSEICAKIKEIGIVQDEQEVLNEQ